MGIKERHERDREAVRRAILDAARELFTSEGYQNVSIRKIAERIEYSPAAIYSYFTNKDDIFFALAEEGFRILGDPHNADHVGELESLQPLARIRAIFWHFYQFSSQHPEYFALMFIDRTVPRISREYERFAFVRDMKASIIDEIGRCVADGALPASVDPAAAMRALSAGILGVAVLRVCDRMAPDEDADKMAANVLDLTLAGIKAGVPLQPILNPDCASVDEPVTEPSVVSVRSSR
ncbi:MAG TPA: TetR/AcrR family transcriptional regulator [Vicinamibacterales bacterium]|jgi:AcrR family transcriptional regulator